MLSRGSFPVVTLARFAPALLLSACSRVPADVSVPAESSPVAQAVAEPELEPLSDDCMSDELASCVSSCYDGKCLEWCAGESCRRTVAELHACMDESEQRFLKANPEPKLEFVEDPDPDPEYGPEMIPTEDSLMRQDDWATAHDQVVEERWDGACSATCTSRVRQPEDGGGDFCADWRGSRYKWAELAEDPEPADPRTMGMLAMLSGSAGGFGMFVLGPSVELADAPVLSPEDSRRAPLEALISSQSWGLSGLDACVGELGDDGQVPFVFRLTFDGQGRVVGAELVENAESSSTDEVDCVAERIAASFELPPRVARDVGRVDIRATVRAAPDYGGLMGVEGGMWGDALGDAYGDDYGYGGLGLSGTGQGGGGTGEGTIGIGTIGTGTIGTGGGGGSVETKPKPKKKKD